MVIYEIGGIDNTGKTTQIRTLCDVLGAEDTFVPPSLVDYCALFPRTLKEREVWYEQGCVEEIISATAIGALNRYKSILESDRDYAVLDRGWITLVASNIARVCYRQNTDYVQAKVEVLDIWAKVGVDRLEKESILLTFENNPVSAVEFREQRPLEDGFKKYLANFDYALKRLSSEYSNAKILDASKPKECITESILRTIKPKE